MERMLGEAVAGGLGVFLGLHLLIWRRWPSTAPRIVLLGILGLLGIEVAVLVAGWGTGWRGTAMWVVGSVTCLVVILYTFVYAGLARSVSVTLLQELRRAGDEPVAFQTLIDGYLRSSRFEDRLGVMDQSGYVRVTGAAVQLTPKGERLARWSARASRLLAGGLQG